MIFTGSQLRDVLKRTEGVIQLRNQFNRTVRMMSASEAVLLDQDHFAGVGNCRRILWIRPLTMFVALNRGSVNTRRIRNADGHYIAHPQIREHRPVRPPMAKLATRNGSK